MIAARATSRVRGAAPEKRGLTGGPAGGLSRLSGGFDPARCLEPVRKLPDRGRRKAPVTARCDRVGEPFLDRPPGDGLGGHVEQLGDLRSLEELVLPVCRPFLPLALSHPCPSPSAVRGA